MISKHFNATLLIEKVINGCGIKCKSYKNIIVKVN